MGTFYELLQVAPSASTDEIKHAFRREVARYHPDKVQHLGPEFQQIAGSKTAELTQAYKLLTNPARRAEYDELVAEGAVSPATDAQPPAPPRRPDPVPPDEPLPETPPASDGWETSSQFAQDREGASTMLRRATVIRVRHALADEFGDYAETPLRGFEVVCVPKPAFWRMKSPPRVLGRLVERVDGPAVTEAWGLAARMEKDTQRDLCVFLMGPVVASPGELAAAIAGQRRKPLPAGGRLVMVPLSTQTWNAHVPSDAPPVVRALVSRLRSQ